jgi:hypothetical protein
MNTTNKWTGFQMTLGGIKMKVRELINILKKVEQNKEIVFYHLKNNDLQSCEYESFLDVDDDFVELTFQDNYIEE